jgi:hypothetical protein
LQECPEVARHQRRHELVFGGAFRHPEEDGVMIVATLVIQRQARVST